MSIAGMIIGVLLSETFAIAVLIAGVRWIWENAFSFTPPDVFA